MNIEMNEVEYCKYNISYSMDDSEKISSIKNDVILQFKERDVPGCRKGKASIEAIRLHYARDIQEQLKRSLAEDGIHEVIFSKKIKPIGSPQFSKLELNGNLFECAFTLHTQPEFELKEYKGFDIPKPPQKMTDDELCQRMLQEIRTKNGSTTAYTETDFIQNGDSVILDYTGSVDDVPIKDLTVEGEIVQVGSTKIAGFDDNLLGMAPGETREFMIQAPNGSQILEGKFIKFVVSLKTGSKVIPMPLDDNLATKTGFKNFEELANFAKATASNRIKEIEVMHITDQIGKRLLANHDFKVPTWLIAGESQVNAKQAGDDWEKISDEKKEKYVDYAEKAIKLSLILSAVREKEIECELSDEEVINIIRQNIAKFDKDPQKVLEELYKNGQLPLLAGRVRDEHTLGYIRKNCNIVE